ncbi:rhamnogalacturonan lyase [Plebeiibacterium sediminum]|uniref:Rhamnogalacturonan lyase n=1 Tax=Plebeiibacterium sediminum TaxID=2992112 RepID=A0AAE3M4L5_9BACT|nr:rhamnogalacturonan lyase [Plebeiobacterium sediminum]MCW3786876.1 rhamnogalacturonan lyase [Plebeiobacterium sediminum]
MSFLNNLIKNYQFLLLLITFTACCNNGADIQKEIYKGSKYATSIHKEALNRGFVAINQGDGRVSLSWRYLPEDSINIAFDLYRIISNKEIKLNQTPLIKSTLYMDSVSDIQQISKYLLKDAASNSLLASYNITKDNFSKPYMSIPIQPIAGDSLWRYSPNDASIGDLDGDGAYEIILKRENSGKDNSHRGVCNGGPIIEAYKLDGTFLWRIDLGINIRQGAHYTQMVVYDFDEDGKAELVVKTAEGTQFADGKVIGDVNKDGVTDYVDRDPDSPTWGKIMSGPEFFSVIDGETGTELARADYIPRGTPNEYGDNRGNRVDRFLAGAGYFDGQHPSILLCRGYYAKTVMQAWDYRDGKLTQRWQFSTSDNNGEYKAYEAQGNHNLAIGDVDGDGKDEITYGACMIDDDGSGAYNTKLGHGDAIHLTDIDIERPGFEVWDCHEHVPTLAGSELRDACTGDLIWGIPSYEDVGRAMAADVDPRFKGLEVWTTHSGGVYTAKGELISQNTPSINFGIWWDGDLNRELLDGSGVFRREFVGITKWTGDGVEILPLPDSKDLAANNWTKGNPCLSADIIGDWREEVIARTKDNKELRIYMTPYQTPYRFHSLMTDIMYRWSVLTQNISYNQPPQLGYYLGSDLGKFWNNTYQLQSGAHSKSGTSEGGHINDMNTRYHGAKRIIKEEIKVKGDEYTLDAGYDYDHYCWMINGIKVDAERSLKLKVSDYKLNELISIELKVQYKGAVFSDSAKVEFIK